MAKKAKKNSNSQKSNIQGEPLIVLWLKRIFSLKVMSFVVAVIALYFTYQGFVSNKPSQISVHNRLGGIYNRSIDLKNIHDFIYLVNSTGRTLPISHETPIIVNNTNKSIKSFNLIIRAFFADSFFSYDWNSSDYDIIQSDTVNFLHVFRYKHDVLYAHSELPLPIESLQLKEGTSFDSDKSFSVIFDYSIAYDGIEGDCGFQVTYLTLFNDAGTKDEEQLNMLLTECYNRGIILENKQDFLVTFVSKCQDSHRLNGFWGNEEFDVMTPEKVFSRWKFEKNAMIEILESLSQGI